jgi:hypothetical protein
MNLAFDVKTIENKAIFIYGEYKAVFTFGDSFFVLNIFSTDSSILYYSNGFGSDGNVFYQNSRLFKYLPWNVFSKMRAYAAEHCFKSDERPYEWFLTGDFFIHLDGPNKRMKKRRLLIEVHDYNLEWIKLRILDDDSRYHYAYLDKIWRGEEQGADIYDDAELNIEYQYIIDNIFVSF